MKKLAFISDLIFTFFVSFLFTACFFRYLQLRLFPALALSIVCGTLTTCAVAAFLHARRKKFFLKKADTERKEKLLLHLALSTADEVTDFFLRYFGQTAERTPSSTATERTQSSIDTECTTAPTRHAPRQISTADDYYFLQFTIAPVNSDDVAKIFRIQTEKQKTLLCAAITDQAATLCTQLNIRYRTGDEVYAALKQANALPETFLGNENAPKRKRRFKLWFSKANARRFLSSAAMVLLVAYLTPFFYYYLIFGVALLLTAVFVRIFGYESKGFSKLFDTVGSGKGIFPLLHRR